MKNRDLFRHNYRQYLGVKPSKRVNELPNNLQLSYALLMNENYLVSLDDLLYDQFIIAIKPKGHRCLLVSQNNKEYLISETGKLLMMLHSDLPNDTNESPNTIIECFYAGNKLILTDLLFWDREDFRNQPAKGRFECLSKKTSGLSPRSLPIVVQDYYECCIENLEFLYNCDRDYLKDGIYFYKENSKYAFGYTDSKYIWKDSYCSLIESWQDKLVLKHNGQLFTDDGIKVFKIPNLENLSEIVQAEVTEIDHFKINKISSVVKSHGVASSWSSVVFHWKLRNRQINFSDFYSVLNKKTEFEYTVPEVFDIDIGLDYNDFGTAKVDLLSRNSDNSSEVLEVFKHPKPSESKELYKNVEDIFNF